MVILFGTKLYGQADVVEKRFSVATQFFHIMYFPLVPIAGLAVFDQGAPKRLVDGLRAPTEEPAPSQEPIAAADSAEAEGGTGDQPPADEEELRIPVPMSGKSVLLGYLRGWGFCLTVYCGLLGLLLLAMSGSDAEAARMFPGFLITAGVGLVLAQGSYYGPWNRATPARARQLCEAIGLDPATLPNKYREPGAASGSPDSD